MSNPPEPSDGWMLVNWSDVSARLGKLCSELIVETIEKHLRRVMLWSALAGAGIGALVCRLLHLT